MWKRKDSNGKQRQYPFEVFWLNNADFWPKPDGGPRDGDTKQTELVLRMRKLMEEYSMTWKHADSEDYTDAT
jgi:hypothetical protein